MEGPLGRKPVFLDRKREVAEDLFGHAEGSQVEPGGQRRAPLFVAGHCPQDGIAEFDRDGDLVVAEWRWSELAVSGPELPPVETVVRTRFGIGDVAVTALDHRSGDVGDFQGALVVGLILLRAAAVLDQFSERHRDRQPTAVRAGKLADPVVGKAGLLELQYRGIQLGPERERAGFTGTGLYQSGAVPRAGRGHRRAPAVQHDVEGKEVIDGVGGRVATRPLLDHGDGELRLLRHMRIRRRTRILGEDGFRLFGILRWSGFRRLLRGRARYLPRKAVAAARPFGLANWTHCDRWDRLCCLVGESWGGWVEALEGNDGERAEREQHRQERYEKPELGAPRSMSMLADGASRMHSDLLPRLIRLRDAY
ncbi:hypothetical protein HRbin27_01076 [bacterium HR27]|nr:hypothetical protein HRbin27_01076 [bacterium HR27]